MRIGILLFNDVEELDFVGPLEVFGIASKLVESLAVTTVSKDGRSIRARYGLQVQPDHGFDSCPALDLLIVPGGRGARLGAAKDKETIAFVKAHAATKPVASVCTGAIVLAEAGLLNGKKATTHHTAIEMLRQYPEVTVVEGARFVLGERVATSAGISAGIDLSLEFVRNHFGEKVARDVAEEMEYDLPASDA